MNAAPAPHKSPFASPALSSVSGASELSPTTERRTSAAHEIAALRRQAREAELKMQAAEEAAAAMASEASPTARRSSMADVSLDEVAAATAKPKAPSAALAVPDGGSPTAAAAAPSLVPAPESYSPRIGSVRTPHDVNSVFITDGKLGIHFNPQSDPPFVILGIASGGLAAGMPQLKVGLVLKAVNSQPVEGRPYDEICASIANNPRPLELSFWRSYAASNEPVDAATVTGTRLKPGKGFMAGSVTEYTVEARTVSGRIRKLYRTFAQFKALYTGWIAPCAAIGEPVPFPSDVMYGANDAAVVSTRAQGLSRTLLGAFAIRRSLRGCAQLDDALQRFFRDDTVEGAEVNGASAAASPDVGTGDDCAGSRLRVCPKILSYLFLACSASRTPSKACTRTDCFGGMHVCVVCVVCAVCVCFHRLTPGQGHTPGLWLHGMQLGYGLGARSPTSKHYARAPALALPVPPLEMGWYRSHMC